MVSTRRSFVKSRNGCQTCKIRHVKCDETHPYCRRCTSTGRTCDGYGVKPSNIRFSPSSSSSSLDTLPSIPPTPSFNALASPWRRLGSSASPAANIQDHRAFAFFRTETAPHIGGFFGTTAWNLVLQACASEVAISQAVIALGALHERSGLITTPQSTVGGGGASRAIETDFPMRKYQQALGSLREYLTTAATTTTKGKKNFDLNVVLMCALIHICIEVMQNNYLGANVHLENSLFLLKGASLKNKDAGVMDNDVDLDLSRAFIRLDILASTYQVWRPPVIAGTPSNSNSNNTNNNNNMNIPIPSRFSSLAQAKDTLDHLTAQTYALIRHTIEDYRHKRDEDLPICVIAEAQHINHLFEQWNDRFENYLNLSTSRFSRHEQVTINILLINHRIGAIEAATCTSVDTMVFDKFDDLFDEVVTLAPSVIRARCPATPTPSSSLNLKSTSQQQQQQRLDISLDIGVILPLYKTAIRCREPWIRQRALTLLRSITFQEGVWSAATQAAMAAVAVREEQKYYCDGLLRVDYNDNDGEADSMTNGVLAGAGGRGRRSKGEHSSRPPEFARFHSVGTTFLDPMNRVAEVMLTRRLNGLDGPWDKYVEVVRW